MEVALDPEEYKRRLRAEDRRDPDGPQDPGNRAVNFRGEQRSNATHRSRTDPDCRFVSKGASGTGAFPGYTVNALMENRHRILLGFGTEIFRSVASETAGCLALLQRAQRRLGFTPTTLGGDKGFFSVGFIEALLGRGIEPHIAADSRGHQPAHARVRMRSAGPRVPAVPTGPEEDRRAVRGGQGLAWAAPVPSARAASAFARRRT